MIFLTLYSGQIRRIEQSKLYCLWCMLCVANHFDLLGIIVVTSSETWYIYFQKNDVHTSCLCLAHRTSFSARIPVEFRIINIRHCMQCLHVYSVSKYTLNTYIPSVCTTLSHIISNAYHVYTNLHAADTALVTGLCWSFLQITYLYGLNPVQAHTGLF